MGNVADDALYQLIGDKVRTARELAGLNQTQLAAKAEVHRVSIVNLEKGRQRPPLHVLWRISQLLDVELADLIPRRADFDAAADGLHLGPEAITHLESVTKGNFALKRELETFINKTSKKPPT